MMDYYSEHDVVFTINGSREPVKHVPDASGDYLYYIPVDSPLPEGNPHFTFEFTEYGGEFDGDWKASVRDIDDWEEFESLVSIGIDRIVDEANKRLADAVEEEQQSFQDAIKPNGKVPLTKKSENILNSLGEVRKLLETALEKEEDDGRNDVKNAIYFIDTTRYKICNLDEDGRDVSND